MYDIVLYHRSCADGFTAAWAAKGALPEGIEFHAVAYDDADYPDVADKHVLVLDFSYKAEKLSHMVDVGKAKTITILDHHKSAQEDLAEFMVGSDGEVTLDDPETFWHGSVDLEIEPIRAWFDMTRSGAQLAWGYFYGGDEVKLVEYVGKRDLWQLDALPNIREVHAWLMAHDFDFDIWSECQYLLEDTEGFNMAMLQGKAILRAHDKAIRELLAITRRDMIIGGYTVSVANMPYTMASDAAHILAVGTDASFAATYYDNHKGQRVFSLRSEKEHGIDVSAIAKQYGGGGHRNAAGFSINCASVYATGIDGIEVVPTTENAAG